MAHSQGKFILFSEIRSLIFNNLQCPISLNCLKFSIYFCKIYFQILYLWLCFFVGLCFVFVGEGGIQFISFFCCCCSLCWHHSAVATWRRSHWSSSTLPANGAMVASRLLRRSITSWVLSRRNCRTARLLPNMSSCAMMLSWQKSDKPENLDSCLCFFFFVLGRLLKGVCLIMVQESFMNFSFTLI